MAGEAPPGEVPLHPNVVLVAQPRRALLLGADAAPAQAARREQREAADRHDHGLHREPEPGPGAVQVDRRRRGHPGESKPCERHFSDTTLGPSQYLISKGAGGTHRSGGRIQSNSISAVIAITVAGSPLALLPGDVDGVGLRDLLEHDEDLHAPILVYPHHGGGAGPGMDPDEYGRALLGAVDPTLVVFSIGRGSYSMPKPETVRILRETLPSSRIVCTQLSEHCSAELRTESGAHLAEAFAAGRAGGKCCGGTVVIPLDDVASILPEPGLHADFIDAHAETALCGRGVRTSADA